MKAVLLTLALASISLAADPFYPKATGQGEARSVNKDIAKFSLSCAKLPPVDYQLPFKGGVKAIISTPTGLIRTINMPEVEDADFNFTRCTVMGKGTLTLDYGKGNVKKYEGSIRATVMQLSADSHGKSPDKLSIAFRSKDLKVPQAAFQGDLVDGKIVVTHPPFVPMNRPQKPKDGGTGDGGTPPPNPK